MSEEVRATVRRSRERAVRLVEITFRSQSQIVIHGNGDLLLGAEIAFSRLY
jgi:hypothetical protein